VSGLTVTVASNPRSPLEQATFPMPTATVGGSGGSGGAAPAAPTPMVAATKELSRIDPGTNEVVATLEMGTRAEPAEPGETARAFEVNSIAAADGSVWVGSEIFGLVRRLDPTTMQFTGDWVEVSWPAKVAVGEGAAWALGYGDTDYGTVFELDVTEGTVVSEIPVAQTPWFGIAAGGGAIWPLILTDDGGEPAAVKIDPESREIEATISVFPVDPIEVHQAVSLADGAVWVTGGNTVDGGGLLLRIDPDTAEIVASIRLDIWPTSMAVGEGRIWVLGWVGEEEKQIHVVDAATNAVIGGPSSSSNSRMTSPSVTDHCGSATPTPAPSPVSTWPIFPLPEEFSQRRQVERSAPK